MDFSFTEEQNMLRESVRKMLDRVATPAYVRAMDEEARYPYEVYDAIVEMGLISMVFPEQYGGLGGSVIDFAIIAEELGRKSYDLMGAYGTSVFNGLNLLHNGSEAQKRHYLPRLMSGEIRMSISMTEPDAGSDAGAMRTFARREGDEWVINGQKVFSTGAGAKNNIISLYAKTDNSVHYRKGISLFLVDNTLPGIRLRKLDTLGRRSLGTYEVFFDNVRIPADCIVGEPNRGWDYMLSGLQLERLMTTAAYCGAAQDVVDQALAYAKERKQFGKPIGNFQAIAHMLADMQTEVEASRLLMLHAAWLLAQGKDALKVLSMAKLFGSEAYVRAANNGMQIMGGYGYIKEFDMQRHFRDARVTTITAGTSQVQRNLIAKLMGLDPK
ncbi:acyl-CoA dehydrogenase family protein [Extensimonas perlucida]|uniref:acyl-CoA dehydrogenase family protein n=1 Tax=Extensimonas perlucida TaxID=2590786 RepID=UPI0011A1E63A|nr:acyl-CoA dehydrogenase family protein [Extensimonas perlucida]